MALFVKKFGGSSVADAERMRRVAGLVQQDCARGHRVVVVVSAMGDTTDDLIALAAGVNPDPSDREMDMLLSTGEQISVAILAMALHALGLDAVSMTGPQAGIHTDHVHSKAKILRIEPHRISEALERGAVVIVAGFQGLAPNQDVATLGRGGSDTTAVALAAALRADRCQIYTDVDGVFTADPRVVPEARKLDEIAYDEMLEMASLGARVLQSRSVEFAEKYNVEMEVLSSFKQAPGTVIRKEVGMMEGIMVRGVAADKEQAKVTVRGVRDLPGMASELFRELAAAHINVDMIVQNISDGAVADISFTVSRDDRERARKTVEAHLADVGGREVELDDTIAKVSIVGVGMRSHCGVAHTMFKALADHQINIQMISTSEIKISVVIDRNRADEAMQVLHRAFELDAAESAPVS